MDALTSFRKKMFNIEESYFKINLFLNFRTIYFAFIYRHDWIITTVHVLRKLETSLVRETDQPISLKIPVPIRG